MISLLIVFLLTQVVTVLSQSTLLDSQCDYECRNDVEIQRLVNMMENIERIMKDEISNLNSQLSDQKNNLENKIYKLDQEVKNHTDTIVKLQEEISELRSMNQMTNVETSTANIVETTTSSVIESSASHDCEDIRALGYVTSGVYGVNGGSGQIKRVYCEMTSDGKAWTRILHRQDNLTEFTYKKWADYEAGFGDAEGSHWMGLIKMNQLTSSKPYKMRVELTDWFGYSRFAEYTTFRVGPPSDNYRLTIGGYSGTAGDSMTGTYTLNNMMFTTIDNDNDPSSGNCAGGTGAWTGGWWYNACFSATLGSPYLEGGTNARLTGTYIEGGIAPPGHGILWRAWRGEGYSYKVATMSVQRL